VKYNITTNSLTVKTPDIDEATTDSLFDWVLVGFYRDLFSGGGCKSRY